MNLMKIDAPISEVSGDLKCEIGSLVRFYSLRKIPYESILGKGVMGKRLKELLCQETKIDNNNFVNSEEKVVPYEISHLGWTQEFFNQYYFSGWEKL